MNSACRHMLVSLIVSAFASAPLPAQEPGVVGTWKGVWTSPQGFVYAGELQLASAVRDSVEGSILWTLKASPRPAEQAKLGLTGREYVRGHYNAACHLLRVAGYRLDDPSGILGMDRYALLLAESGTVLGGITWDHGTWTGQFLLTR